MGERNIKPKVKMRSKNINFIILVSLISLFIVTELFSNEIHICSNCEIRTLKSAIELSKENDILIIDGGTYAEGEIEIKKPIKIIGKNLPIIDGKNERHVIKILSSGVHIEGLKIINSGVSDVEEFAGIITESVSNVRIINNIFENNTYSIYLSKTKSSLVENNSITGNALDEVMGGNGIHVWSSTFINIRNNKITKHRDGLYLEFSENLLIENNWSEESLRYGMHFMFSHNNIFFKNTFFKNATGVAIMYSREIIVTNNVFRKNWGNNSYGILIKDITGSKFHNNIFDENTIAIKADSSSRNTYYGNHFKKNGWAVQIFGNCENNIFSGNSFTKNIFDISTNSRQNENSYIGNYWDIYDGYDLDNDGIGDKPYFPVKIFSYWVANYPFLMVLFRSPVIEALEIAERAFPVLTPSTLLDSKPKLKPFAL